VSRPVRAAPRTCTNQRSRLSSRISTAATRNTFVICLPAMRNTFLICLPPRSSFASHHVPHLSPRNAQHVPHLSSAMRNTFLICLPPRSSSVSRNAQIRTAPSWTKHGVQRNRATRSSFVTIRISRDAQHVRHLSHFEFPAMCKYARRHLELNMASSATAQHVRHLSPFEFPAMRNTFVICLISNFPRCATRSSFVSFRISIVFSSLFYPPHGATCAVPGTPSSLYLR
jgi:hypothetical protein